MDANHESGGERDGPQEYEIRIKGHLDDRWADWFDGMSITRDDNGETRLYGPVVDQAALHALLRKVRDIGLPLLSVSQGDPKRKNKMDRTDGTSDLDQNRLNKETNR